MSYSLRNNLIIWLCIPLFTASGLLLWDTYHAARQSANTAYDSALYASALAIADHVVVNDSQLEIDLPYIALEMLSSMGEDHIYYKVAGEHNAYITGYKELPDSSNATDAQSTELATFFDSQFRGQTVRIVELHRSIHRQEKEYPFIVYVAETVSIRDKLAQELTHTYGSRFLLMIVIVIAAAWLGTSRALKPVKKLQNSLSQRSYYDLTPVKIEVPSELSRVVTAINQLMERLRSSFSDIRSFVDDASHQLRTPIASLRTQLEVALDEPDIDKIKISLSQMLETTKRTGRLTDQLLVHAKAIDKHDFEQIELNALVHNVTRYWIINALDHEIDLGLEPCPTSINIDGSSTLLSEALNNLIHNAIHYCPSGSTVTVKLYLDNKSAIIGVEDNGPGIPESQRQDAMKRFKRFYQEKISGFGLGLAITKDVVELHNGTLTLLTPELGKGLLVQMKLPVAL